MSPHQLHGLHAQHIKNKWQYQQHLGESGWPGTCYIKVGDGTHIGLNMCCLAAWAAAMVSLCFRQLTDLCSVLIPLVQAAGETTKYLPPNIPDFNGVHDSTCSISTPHGCAGPLSQAAPTPSSTSTTEHTMSLMMDFLTVQAKATMPTPAPPLPVQMSHQNTPIVTFPLSTLAAELQRFLEDFCCLKGIGITTYCATLKACVLSPDIFAHLTVTRITKLTGLAEGHAVKLQVFGKQWSTSLEDTCLANSAFQITVIPYQPMTSNIFLYIANLRSVWILESRLTAVIMSTQLLLLSADIMMAACIIYVLTHS